MGWGRWEAVLLAATLLLPAASLPAAAPVSPAAPPVQFTDVTRAAGIDFKLFCGGKDKLYIIETVCGGVAFFDYDNDGWMDLLLVNGYTLGGSPEEKPVSKLYRNNGDGTFTDVTTKVGLGFRGWGMGVAIGDYDNDGWSDVYISYFQGGALYRNQGDGTFRDVTAKAGVGNPGRWGTSTAFADYDKDGYLDLYVANYVHLDLNNLPEFGSSVWCNYRGIPVYCGPRGLVGDRDRLYHNNGDGTFADVTEALDIDPDAYYGLGVVWFDSDDDGYPDLFVANDSTPSLLYHNNGDGTFTEMGVPAGVALSADGREQAGMGADSADYNNDGRLDLVKTNFSDDTNNLYHNDGDGWFSDLGGAANFARISVPLLGFGVRFFDYDNDGWKDIYVANGHVNPQVDEHSFGVTYAQRSLLFHNRRDGSFEEVGLQAGPALAVARVGRGAASADFDNDGDLDLLMTNLDGSPLLLRNDGGHRQHWIRLRAVGTQSNRDGYGARVQVRAGGLTQTDEVRANSSYVSAHDPRLHFGLGDATKVDEIVIRWPSGAVDKLQDEEANQDLVVEEGRGVVARRPSGRPRQPASQPVR